MTNNQAVLSLTNVSLGVYKYSTLLGACWPSILVIFAYPKSIYLPPYSILFHLYMPHFSAIFHIQVTRLSFSNFGNFCKNWVLRVNLDCTKNSCNSFIKVTCARHVGESWAHIWKYWEPLMDEHLLVRSKWANTGPGNTGKIPIKKDKIFFFGILPNFVNQT